MKFTISIPRESCTNAKSKYSSSVVPPDPSVHFYHWLREALCIRDESDFVSYTCRYCPVLSGCIHVLLREDACMTTVISQSIHAVIVLCWQDAFTCCYMKHCACMTTVIS